jgi:hypothetical protein
MEGFFLLTGDCSLEPSNFAAAVEVVIMASAFHLQRLEEPELLRQHRLDSVLVRYLDRES